MLMRMRPYVAQMLSMVGELTPLVLVVALYWQECPALAEAVAAAAATRPQCRVGARCRADRSGRGWATWSKVAALSLAHLGAVMILCVLKHPGGVAVVADMGRRAVVRLTGCRCPYRNR